ncbi:UDP-N-acetylglucosamine 1-carboxyvinyltransferase [Clostridium sp.]|uniref:UDP-N-acetylglucosamine 1-carboxyvinyltransferase n=1 Tax=Clostridium sp. TaxID=1506 RepID=UPI0039916424
MEKIIVRGGNALGGEVTISAAKNSVLPIIVASILSDDTVIIDNVPFLEDVKVISEVLVDIGCEVNFNRNENSLEINSSDINKRSAKSELVQKMRASFLIMGPMIAKYKRFKIASPGGCNIGSRPIDLHIKGFEALGAIVTKSHGFIEVDGSKMKGGIVYLDFPSVGATENLIMLATLLEGKTIIENAAMEPEIEDLASFLISMGAKIKGAGTKTVEIEGVKSLKGTRYTPIYDRIEAGTFMIAAAISNSTIKIHGVEVNHLKPVIEKLKEIGTNIEVLDGSKSVIVTGNKIINPTDIITMPYPGFPTDMQSQMMSLLSISNGISLINETVFENRFMNAIELQRMGADIKTIGNVAVINGVNRLTGSDVRATDLRSGASLILAGLIADGYTTIRDVYHIDRGYVNIEEKFRGIGANIYRINENE